MANKKQNQKNYKNNIEKRFENEQRGDFFNQFFGTRISQPDRPLNFEKAPNVYPWQKKEPRPPQRIEFTVFKHEDYQEKYFVPRQVEQLISQIRQEIKAIKQSNRAFLTEVKNIEKVVLQPLPEKAGVYHIRFLEILLSFLKALRAKVGEAKTWLAAMMTKRKKRGSLFLALSKKKGTQYSLSSELQTARGVM